jgi:hypothetical protein
MPQSDIPKWESSGDSCVETRFRACFYAEADPDYQPSGDRIDAITRILPRISPDPWPLTFYSTRQARNMRSALEVLFLSGHRSNSLAIQVLKEDFMKRNAFLLAISLVISTLPVWGQPRRCENVGGVLMTNIGAIAGVTNLGPVSGDLAGSVAATILGQNTDGTYNVQHYWVTATGETVTLKVAVLTPTYPTGNKGIVAVPWGNYSSKIIGGTGKFEGARGHLDYFGMADFIQNTLVLRYRGEVCYANPDK